MTDKLDTLSTFVWCAVFAGAASLFQSALEVLSEKNDKKKFSRRDFARVLVQVLSVAFYGGLSGWAVTHIFPEARGELLGIVAAVLGSGGPKAQRLFLSSAVEMITRLKVTDHRNDP